MFLSKAFFRKKEYESCLKLLDELALKYPNDMRISYNLAHVLYNLAKDVFNLERRSVVITTKAINDLKKAKNLFI